MSIDHYEQSSNCRYVHHGPRLVLVWFVAVVVVHPSSCCPFFSLTDLPRWFHHNRCTDSQFWVHEKKTNGALINSCLKLISKKLRNDICFLRSSSTLAAEVQWDAVNQCLFKEVQYACLYWVQHIQRARLS